MRGTNGEEGAFIHVVVALRSLAEKSWFWPPSNCPHCQKRLSPLDLVPILSYMLLGAKCRYCKKPISWQYPAVEFATAGSVFAILTIFGWTLNGLAMLIFVSTLIAVTVTDFREKLIPHEITYPSMLIGITYSGLVWNDLLGTLAGIGVSYILFDFIDFYGLIFLKFIRRRDAQDDEEEVEVDPVYRQLDENFKQADEFSDEDEIVMGGGDAVLAAVISAWLGWQKLVMAIFIAFIVGALMGAIYLFVDLKRRGELNKVLVPGLIGFALGFACLFFPMSYIVSFSSSPSDPSKNLLIMGLVGGMAGSMVGMIFAGSKFENRFPFGPAIALGGIFAIFCNVPGQPRNLVPVPQEPVGHNSSIERRQAVNQGEDGKTIVRLPQKERAYSRP